MQCRRMLSLFLVVLLVYMALSTMLYFYIINFTEWGGGGKTNNYNDDNNYE